jgi:hypothetical protein
MSKPKKKINPLEVLLLEARPNPMFPEWLTVRLRFLRYSQPVKCAYCGRMSRHHWTLLLAFRIAEGFEKKIRGKVVPSQSPVATKGKELFPPLTPVCRKHLLHPNI